MCGQCGILAGSIISSEMKTFLVNLRMNIFRGRDSTGMVAVTRPTLIAQGKGKKDRYRPMRAQVWKEPRDAWAFLAFDDLDKKKIKKEMIDPVNKRLMMGHCRAATVGNVTAENAHPFVAGDIIGMHNGTIKKLFKGTKDFETDSEALFNLVNEVGIKDALQEVEAYTTAYALQYYNKATNTFHVVRNADRPLWFVYTKSRGALLWSSEEIDLRFAAKKAGLELEDKSFQPKPYELMTFDLLETDPHSEFTTEDLTPKKAYIPVTPRADTRFSGTNASGGQGTSKYNEYNYNKDYTIRTHRTLQHVEVLYNHAWIPKARYDALMRAKDTFTEDETPIGKAETERYVHTGDHQVVFQGYMGKNYMKKDFNDLLMRGCVNCGTQPSIDTEDIEYKLGWYGPIEFFCETCTDNEETQKFLVKYQLKKPDESPFVETQVDPNEDT